MKRPKKPAAAARTDPQEAALVWWATLYARLRAMRKEFWADDNRAFRQRMAAPDVVDDRLTSLLDTLAENCPAPPAAPRRAAR